MEKVVIENQQANPVITKKARVLYNNQFSSYYQNQYIDSHCNEITFINNGTTDVLLNSTLILKPDASISFDGKAGEYDETQYRVQFTSGVGLISNLVVIRKFYNS